MQSFVYDNYQNFANSLIGGISSVLVANGGTSYSNTDTISIVRDSHDTMTSDATFSIVTDPAGKILSVDVEDPGEYIVMPTISVTSSSGHSANISLSLSSDQWYSFAGHSTPWANEYSPDPASTSLSGSFYDVHQQMYAGSKILPENVVPIIPNAIWMSNTVYSQYDDQESSLSNFYVVSTGGNVFKCLNNAQGSPSTVPPTLPSAGSFTPPILSDGYQWLYMYNIQSSLADTNYIPVENSNNNFVVLPDTPYGVDGAIYNVSIESAGSGYYHSSGSILSVSGFNITLSDNPTQYSGIYKGYYLTVIGAQNEVNNYIVSDSFSGGNHLSILIASSSQIDANTMATGYSYFLSPAITVTGDGTEFLAYTNIDPVSNSISSVHVINPGSGYSFANAVVSSATLGTNAVLRPIISPPGGHGSDPVRELKCEQFCIQSQLPDMSPSSPQFRQIGLLKNPLGFLGEQYGAIDFDQRITLTFQPSSVFCVVGENLLSQDGKSLLTVCSISPSTNQAIVTGYRGRLTTNEVMTGDQSGCSLTVSAIGSFSGLKLNSGDIDYLNNISPISDAGLPSPAIISIIAS